MKQRSVALLAVLVLVLTACGGGGAGDTTVTADTGATTTAAPVTTAEATTTTAASADVNLLVWADEARTPVVEEVAAAFTEATGVTVTVETKEFGDIRDQMVTAGPAGEGADIFIGAHDWVGELAANGVAEPIDLGAKSGEFEQVAIDAFTYQGSLYAVPYATEAIAFYYNTDLVPEAPATFEELAGICAGLDGIENCVGVPGGGDAPDAYHNYPFVSALGGYIFGYDPASGYDTTDVGLDSEGAIAGIGVSIRRDHKRKHAAAEIGKRSLGSARYRDVINREAGDALAERKGENDVATSDIGRISRFVVSDGEDGPDNIFATEMVSDRDGFDLADLQVEGLEFVGRRARLAGVQVLLRFDPALSIGDLRHDRRIGELFS